MPMLFTLWIIVVVCLTPGVGQAKQIMLEYPGFTLWYDCNIGGPVAARYELWPDREDIERAHSFFLEPNLPPGCRGQTSTDTYASVPNAPDDYDLGHLVPANHLDNQDSAISASNVMTNITPQQSSFNRTGAWRKTEKLIECWRDEEGKGPLIVWIAVIWGNDTSDDHFINSHGIVTPDRLMKLVYRPKEFEAVAWDLPNQKLTATQLKDYTVAPAVVIAATGLPIILRGVNTNLKRAAWPDPGCDQG